MPPSGIPANIFHFQLSNHFLFSKLKNETTTFAAQMRHQQISFRFLLSESEKQIMKKQILFVRLLLTLLVCIASHAATPQSYQVFRYSQFEGLNETSIKSIAQSKDGALWLSTDNGLIRFDGIRFYEYNRPQYPIVSSYFKYVLQRSTGNLLAITDEELLEIRNDSDPANTKMATLLGDSFSNRKVNGITVNYPKVLYEDSQQNVWIANTNSLIRYDKQNQFKQFPFPEDETSSDVQKSFFIAEGENELYVVTTKGSLYKFDSKQDKFIKLRVPSMTSKANCAVALSDRKILVATTAGLVELTLNKAKTSATSRRFFTNSDMGYFAKTSSGKVFISVRLQGLYQITSTSRAM